MSQISSKKAMSSEDGVPLTLREVLETWWPLALSWLFMGSELPAVSAAMARLPDPEINLAAYGGVVFPLALIIESPIIMLLAASTALSRDIDSYSRLRRFMMISGAALTGLHVLIAFTPLYYFVVEQVMGVPAATVGPARIGLQIMLPWSWLIAYRRFNQGVLIGFGRARAVGIGTFLRLSVNLSVLSLGLRSGAFPGIVVGPTAVIAGVLSEAIYSGITVRPVRQALLPGESGSSGPLSLRTILDFYVPLAMTSLLFLLVQPIGSAAMSRMPEALPSLAVWPVISGLLFMIRSIGMAYNEVVVALLGRREAVENLGRFAAYLAAFSSMALILIALSPAAPFWFERVSGLSRPLSDLAQQGLLIALAWPALTVYTSWFQGAIVFGRQTRGITEAVVVYLVVSTALLIWGILWGEVAGLLIALGAAILGSLAQALWLRRRSAPILIRLRTLAAAPEPASVAEHSPQPAPITRAD